MKCDMNLFRGSARISQTAENDRDLLIYIAWRLGVATNQQIGERFGLIYSAVSQRVTVTKEKLNKDRELNRIYSQLFFGFFHDFPQGCLDTVGQRIGPVRFENVPGFFKSPLMQIRAAAGLPVLPHPAIDQRRLRLLFHMPEGVIVAEKIFGRADLMHYVDGQRFIIDRYSLQRILDHAGELVVHYQLAIVNCHAHFDHPQAVYQVGTCQRRQQAGEGFFVTGLSITYFGVALPAGYPAGQ